MDKTPTDEAHLTHADFMQINMEIMDPVDRPTPEFVERLREFIALNVDDAAPEVLAVVAPFRAPLSSGWRS